ncbi:hypothetical protein CC80DRAFT_408329 [Byssothecium circinans]|uniref:FHA domain-containing protein n=1 Tax=Byssothecium circinans TaxID=147558 RepID=A0A6A5U4K9_9PLEO|nr:hypothetical protein CC80DRAFT_408329 [Byssothecium circinans]
MWFLEHETLFGGKRVWLRPGSQQLFGRTKPTDGDSSEGKKVFIDNKNVSRKHMMIKVLEVPPENGTKLHTRSQVEVIDLSCRQGTTVDAQSLKSMKAADGSVTYDKITLTDKEHSIKLSNSYPPFKIKWQGLVFTTASKEKKGNATSVDRIAQLHAMDIKTSTEFIYGKTTHVVSQKRNLPKVLQALVSAKPIVTTEFLDAVLSTAAYSVDANGNYVPSQLEEDFDAWWPQERGFIPPAGAEPVARPENMLEPDPARSEVFAGLTFVFLDGNQHANLHQVVALGGGKALLYDIHLGETTVEEYVEYVKNIAGQKKRGRIDNAALPVVTIRLAVVGPDELTAWATDFVKRVDHSLNQRSIIQNEFLDAILTKDNSQLRRPPTEVPEADSNMAPTTRSQRSKRETTPAASQIGASSQAPEPASVPEQPAKTIPRKRPIRRGATSRFSGFDDYEPPAKTRKIGGTPMEDVQESMPVEEQSSQPAPITQTQNLQNTRSQVADDTVPIEEERARRMEELFPAAAAIKRQREVTRAPSASIEPETAPKTQTSRKNTTSTKNAVKEMNIREETRKFVQEQETRRQEEEGNREAQGEVDPSLVRANIVIEMMAIRPREQRPSAKSQVKSDRWDPAWDGRKNFKKFKKKGQDREPYSQRVLVSFEEAPGKHVVSVGGVEEGERENETFLRTKEDERRVGRRQGLPADSNSEPEPGFIRKKKTKPTEVVNVEDSGPDDEEDPVTSTRGSGRTQRVAETQVVETQTQSRGKKRGPVTVAAGQPNSKKSRYAKRDDSDSDAEETGFRFKRRG